MKSVKKLLKVDANTSKIYITTMCKDTKRELADAVNNLADAFHNYFVDIKAASDKSKDDLLIHTSQLIILNLVCVRNKDDVFDLDFMQWKLTQCIDHLNTSENRKKLENMFRETHDRIISYRDLKGG